MARAGDRNTLQRALADDPWNPADAQIREIAASNGIIGVTAVHGMLAPGRTSSILHVVKQILYLVQVPGSDHVALGIGFESGVSPLVDLKSAADSPRLAADLRDAGMSEEDIARVFYKNALRVLCATPGAPLKAGQLDGLAPPIVAILNSAGWARALSAKHYRRLRTKSDCTAALEPAARHATAIVRRCSRKSCPSRSRP